MKQIYLISILWIALWQLASAQQEQLYTQFMNNKLAWNPAYAGSFESPTLVAVYRNQFIGLEGAPKTVALSFNMAYNSEKKVAFGANIVQYKIGITHILNLDILPFTYIIQMKNGNLSMGFQVSVRQFAQDWSDPRLVTFTSAIGDGAIPTEDNNKIIVNPGVGFFYKSIRHNWYAGLAVPRILPNNIDFSSAGAISREVLEVNAMGGYTFKTTDDIKIAPQVLLKYAVNAPFQADINGTILLKDKYLAGLTYRTGGGQTSAIGESVDIQLGLQATEKLFFCLSYDIGLTPLRKYHKGSVELTARYWFNPPPPEDTPIAVPY